MLDIVYSSSFHDKRYCRNSSAAGYRRQLRVHIQLAINFIIWTLATAFLPISFHDKRYCTLIKKKIKFSSYIIHLGAVAKTYMRKGFLIYEEMRKYLVIYEEAVSII
jgi:hypothetical protein